MIFFSCNKSTDSIQLLIGINGGLNFECGYEQVMDQERKIDSQIN